MNGQQIGRGRRRILSFVASGLLGACLLAACGGGDVTGDETSADAYPTKRIEVIVPFPAGGGADAAIRTLQPSLEQTLGQSLVILNKAGGAGTVGTSQASAAEPDGYTWLLVTIGPATTQPHIQDVSYDPDSFIPVTLVNNEPQVVVVPADSEIQDLDDLIAAAEAGDLTWAAPPVGGAPHLTGELILGAVDGSARMVPFDGTGPALTALLGGQIDVASLPAGTAGAQVEDGQLRALGVTSAERMAGFPDIPTLTEQGVDVEVTNWNGIALPAGTPDEVVATVEEAVSAAIQSDEYQALLEQGGVGLEPVSLDDFADLWKADHERFGDLIESLKQEGVL